MLQGQSEKSVVKVSNTGAWAPIGLWGDNGQGDNSIIGKGGGIF